MNLKEKGWEAFYKGWGNDHVVKAIDKKESLTIKEIQSQVLKYITYGRLCSCIYQLVIEGQITKGKQKKQITYSLNNTHETN